MKNISIQPTVFLSEIEQQMHRWENAVPKFLRFLFTAFMIIGGVQTGVSQTVIQIGTGTSAPSVGTNPNAGVEGCSPYGVNVGSGAGGKKVQLIYTKAMIETAMTTAGFTPGTAFIHTVGFNITGIVTSGFNHQNYTIKMANVAQADLSGGYYTGSSTTVYGPASFAPTATGWYSLTIGTPFQWDGTSNLCVEVCYNYTGVGLITTYGACQYTAVGGNNHMGFAGGAAASCATAFPGTGSQTNRLSNMRLTVTSATPCSGAPAISTAGSATVCNGSTTTIGLTGLVGASGYTYLWKYSAANGGPYTPASGTNTSSTYTTPTTLPSNPAYYICEVTCSGNTTPSNQGTVSLNSFLNCYCNTAFTSAAATAVRGLTNVNLVGNSITLNNTTAANTASPSPYNLYATPVADITAGSSYNLKTTVGTATNILHYTAAWIDYDNDGKFGGYTSGGVYNAIGDYGVGGLILERISTQGPTANIQTTTNFTVPVNATTGNTAMRVRYRYGATLNGIGACQQITGAATTGGAGEVEDYRVFIASACVAPSTGASASVISNTLPTSVDLNWTNGSGTGGRIILVKQGSAVNSIPLSGTTYTDNATFGSGTQIGIGNYVVYDGTGSSTTISGLLPSTTYHYSIFEYNSTSTCYIATGHTGSFISGSCSPTIQPSALLICPEYTSLNLSFVRGNGARTLVVARAGSAVNADPVYTSAYTASSTFGSGSQIGTGNYVVYNGNDPGSALVNLTGLTQGTTYHFKLYEYFETPNCYSIIGAPIANSATRNAGAYTSSTTTQISTTVAQNLLAQQVVSLQVVVGGGADPAAIMNSITFNTTGSTNAAADIVNAKIFYTGTSSTFSNATQYGSTFTSFAGNLTATDNFALLPGTNYFWVAYDLKLAATISNVLDASIVSFNITDNTGTSVEVPTVLAPAGSRSIVSSAPSGYCIPSPAVEAVGDYITAPTWSGGDLGSSHLYGGGNSSGSGVNNRTAQAAPTLTPGVTYTLSYYAEDFIGNTNSVWIDWDQSGTWNATAPELVRNSGASYTVTQSVTVPLTATPGATRMRIINRFPSAGTNACVTSNGSSTSAVYVDYTVIVAGAVGVQAVSCATLAPVVTSPVTYAKNDVASQLTATGTGLLWYTAPTGGVGSSTAPTPLTTTAGTTSYYVSQTSGCEGPRTQIAVSVTTSCGPIAFSVTGGNNCYSSTVGLANSETGVTYELYLDGVPLGITQPGTTGNPISFGVKTAPGIYTVVGTDAQPASTNMIGNARVYENPTALINGTLIGCSPAGVTITTLGSTGGSGSITGRQWKESGVDIPLETGSSYNATANGNYTVEITNSLGCSATSAVSAVVVNTPPTVSFSGATLNTCENQNVMITDAVYANASAHTWSIILGNGTLINTGTFTPTYQPVASDAGTTVIVRLTVSNSPCADAFAQKSIDIAPRPIASPTSALISPSNSSQAITISNIDINSTYSWTPASDLYMDVDLTVPYILGTSTTTVYSAPFSSVTYNVTATNTITGCTTGATSIVISVDPAITNQICDANLPDGLVPVTTSPNFIVRSLTGSSASPGASCAAINKDIWFRAVVPANGEIHVMTQEHNDPVASKNITSALVQIFTAATCSTSVSAVACDAGGAAGNMAYARAGGLIPGSTVYIRLAKTTAGNTAPSQYVRLAVTSGLTWTGAVNSSFTDPSNWKGGDATALTIPSNNTTVIIPATAGINYPILVGTQTVHGIHFISSPNPLIVPSITIPVGSELRLQASSSVKSSIEGSFASSAAPKILGHGTLRFNEGGLNTGSVDFTTRFYGVVAVRSGVTLAANGKMRFEDGAVLLSGGVATGDVNKNYSGTVTGNILYIRSGSVYGGYNYWSSPVSGATTNIFYSSYGNNIYQYDNTIAGGSIQGSWGSPIIAPIPLQNGRGYIQTFAGNGTVSFSGTPIQTPVSVPVTVTGSNNYNLLGNPYPSALSFSSFRASNSNVGSVYLWHSSTAPPYNVSSYVVISGLGVLAGNPVSGYNTAEIGSGQGFLTQVSGNGTVNFNPNQVVPNYPGNSTQFLETNDQYSIVRLRLSSADLNSFDVVVGFGTDGTEGVDFGYDSPRMPSSETLELYTMLGQNEYTTQFLPELNSARIVELGTVTTGNGTFTFDLNMFENFDPSVRVFLEDRKTGAFSNLNHLHSYSFVNDPSYEGNRFRLHFIAPVAYSATGACTDAYTGKILLSNPNTGYAMAARLKDAAGSIIAQKDTILGEYIFENLLPGNYALETSFDAIDYASIPVQVNGFETVADVNIISSATVVSIDQAIIEFTTDATGASNLVWDFGDGSPLVSGNNVFHPYLQTGVYTVTLHVNNDACSSSTTLEIRITDDVTGLAAANQDAGNTVFPNPANETLTVLITDKKPAVFEMKDMTGKLILHQLLNGTVTPINTSILEAGVYMGTIKQTSRTQTFRIVVAH